MRRHEIIATYYALLAAGVSRRRVVMSWKNHGNETAAHWHRDAAWRGESLRGRSLSSPRKRGSIGVGENGDMDPRLRGDDRIKGKMEITRAEFKKNYEPLRDAAAEWERLGRKFMLIGDAGYPSRFHHLHDPPLALNWNGDADCWAALERDGNVCAVGSRAYDEKRYGVINATFDPLPERTVVSGMAVGADAAVHEWALERAHCRTVAIVGCGLDRLNEWQRDLAQRIAARGLVISEYVPNDDGTAWHFPERNRLLAALGDAAVIVAAHEKSGTMITARLAAELGRDVYAVPWTPGSPFAGGGNKLLAQGATPLYARGQLFGGPEESLPFGPEPGHDMAAWALSLADENQRAVAGLLAREGARDLNAVMAGLPQGLRKRAAEALFALEEAGHAARDDFGNWHLNPYSRMIRP